MDPGGERNSALKRAVPVPFVRSEIIKSANRDLALAAAAGFAATIDPLHLQVAAQRFNDDTWKLRGYVVPFRFPWVGNLPWEAIADLRRDRHMVQFRTKLREIEEEAAAARRWHRRRLSRPIEEPAAGAGVACAAW